MEVKGSTEKCTFGEEKTVLENKTSPVSGLRKRGKLNLNVNVRTFVSSKALSPSERGRNLLTQALSSPQRKRASLRINQTLRRHVSHVDKSEEIREKSKKSRYRFCNTSVGLTHNTDPTKQRPLALGRRRPESQTRGRSSHISVCVYASHIFVGSRVYVVTSTRTSRSLQCTTSTYS